MAYRYISAFLLCFFLAVSAYSTEYHVAKSGNNKNAGTKMRPFRTINYAAQIAKAGDTITVHNGIYREQVEPLNGGTADNKRIVYRAAPNEKVEIKGSEIIAGWKKESGSVWKAIINDDFFGNYNPYTTIITGDWYFGNFDPRIFKFNDWIFEKNLHTGEVYLNGKALHEVDALNKLKNNFNASDPVGVDSANCLNGTYTWYCTHENNQTIIYANFHEHDPNKSFIEINVRPTIFYPAQTGRNYITVKGFIMSQAATQWAAPTAEQVGIIGTNWSKGWVIEDNIISQSKCVGITLGKDKVSGHNPWSDNMQKDGSVIYNEMIHRVINNGWNKLTIGSHAVRNNTIFDCGVAGICGSFGAAYSKIIHNHIYNIYTYRPYWGAEMGGIKIHGAIDVLIKNNRVHNTYQGIWLDWMAQGTRVSANLCYDNDYVDFFFEVNHGPYIVDNNLLLSAYSIKDWSEGGAYVHNLIAGMISHAPQDRETPWFKPHSTKWMGIKNIRGGDNRFYNNIFIGIGPGQEFKRSKYLPDDAIDADRGYGLQPYNSASFPVVAEGNVYLFGALNSNKETNFKVAVDLNPKIRWTSKSGDIVLNKAKALDKFLHSIKNKLITTSVLGKTVVANGKYENPDGSVLKFGTDYFGNRRNKINPLTGPFENIQSGKASIKVW